MATDWLRYVNQGATRNLPINNKLMEALSFLPELGVTMEVFSGGQPGKGSGKPRVGSTRHDHGNAADVFFYKDGRKLDWANPDDLPIFQSIVQRGRAAGVTGFGAGEGYMQPGSMHIGFGSPAVWGDGGSGANAPDWLRSAFNGAPAPQTMAQAAPQTAPGAAPSLAPPPQPQSPFGPMLGGSDPVSQELAQIATSMDEDKPSFADRLSKAGKFIDAFTPEPPRISGGMGDARSTGNSLLEYLKSMRRA